MSKQQPKPLTYADRYKLAWNFLFVRLSPADQQTVQASKDKDLAPNRRGGMHAEVRAFVKQVEFYAEDDEEFGKIQEIVALEAKAKAVVEKAAAKK